MVTNQVDAVVVGGGILGLATAVEILQRHPAWSVVVLEKEAQLALHQSGRNSGVIHSGVYYSPGSLKAELCAEGRRLLLEFCQEENVPHEVCGKVIVATDRHEAYALEALEERASANNVRTVRLGPAGLRELEPSCVGTAALHVPATGLVDYRLVCAALARRLIRFGGVVRCATRVTRVHETGAGVAVRTAAETYRARFVVACVGVHADALAGADAKETRIVPFRGTYFALRPEARRLCRNLIYPVPDARFPFLGVHVNRRTDGEVWAGPNALVALALEGYRRRDVDVRDAWRILSYPGFLRLVGRHWREGSREAFRDLSRRAYAAQARRYLPDLSANDLVPAPAGIRAQALHRDGRLVDDFLFAGDGRVVHVRNAPSPAATSALAIARRVVSAALGDRR